MEDVVAVAVAAAAAVAVRSTSLSCMKSGLYYNNAVVAETDLQLQDALIASNYR